MSKLLLLGSRILVCFQQLYAAYEKFMLKQKKILAVNLDTAFATFMKVLDKRVTFHSEEKRGITLLFRPFIITLASSHGPMAVQS